MNGNLIAWPNTNQTSAIRPTQIPETSHGSEFLSRISQVGIPQRRATLIKIDIFHDLVGELAHTLSVRLFGRASRRLDGALELAGLRVGGGERSNEDRIAFLGELIRFCRELNGDFVISERIIRAGRHHP